MASSVASQDGLHSWWSHLLSGLLVLVPLWITVLVIKMVFTAMASVLQPVVQLAGKALPDYVVFLISVGVFVLLVYFVGVITAHVFGRRLVAFGEALILRIPVVRSIYGASKQVVDAISVSQSSAFKSVVLVEFPRPGMQAIGFVTGTVETEPGRRLQKVFVPTAPNPTTGFLVILPADQVRTTNLSVEAGLKMIVSGGVIAPDQIATAPFPSGG